MNRVTDHRRGEARFSRIIAGGRSTARPHPLSHTARRLRRSGGSDNPFCMQCFVKKKNRPQAVAREAGREMRGVGGGGAAGAARGDGGEGAGDGLGSETGRRKALARGARCAFIFFEGQHRRCGAACVGPSGGGLVRGL